MRFILADDHILFREGLKFLLAQNADFSIVAEAGDASALKQQVQQHEPDMVLMDYQMPGDDSAAVLAWLKQRYPALRIIVLTGVQSGVVLQQLLDAGADGLMLKEGAGAELLAGIARVAAGERYLSPAAKLRLGSAAVALTPREFQILQAIAAGQSSQQIAARLVISVRTVDKHRENLMGKLKVSNAIQLLEQARLLQLLP
ncbi:response regulator transcription factor [Chitinibacter sp. FCG-7]|uniref:Response regulator transcription factor n=1 Tax=Chitinibacter mangrovi TaxID=3153927 RepID=A0AAU7FCM5_9NEIS